MKANRWILILVGFILAVSGVVFIRSRLKAAKEKKDAEARAAALAGGDAGAGSGGGSTASTSLGTGAGPGAGSGSFPADEFPLKQGSRGEKVKQLQRYLMYVDGGNKSISGIASEDGIFGPAVEGGVMREISKKEISKSYWNSFIQPLIYAGSI